MRCAALAEAWLDARLGTVRFEGEFTIPFVRQRLESLGVATGAPDRHDDRDAVLVVDTYDINERARCGRRRRAALRVLVDDLGETVPAGYSVVWNPNAYGNSVPYAAFAGPVLTGIDALPLRKALPSWSGRDARSVGVSLGGRTPPPALRTALISVLSTAALGGVVATGDWGAAGWEAADASMPWRLLSRCGTLVTSAGSTVWEAASVGIPVVVVRTADNQRLIAEWASGHVPTIDAGLGDEAVLARRLREALGRAAPLPRLRSGAATVAAQLARLAFVTAGR